MGTNSTMMAVIGATEKSRVYRRDEGKRGHGEGEDSKKRDLVRMRNKETDGAAVDRAAESSDEIVESCLQRFSDAHLRHDYGRHDRPQRQGELYKLRKRKSQHGGNCHPD